MSDLAQQADELEKLYPSSKKTSLADMANELEAMSSQQKQDAIDQTIVGSNTENVLAGAGKGLVDLGRGSKQLIDIPAKWLEKRFPGISEWSQSHGMTSAEKSAEITNADVAESRVRDAPLMGTKAGIGGDIAGTIAGTMVPLSGIAKVSGAAKALLNPATYKTAMASGAIQGALQPVTGDESRSVNTGIGAGAGAFGNLAVNTIGRIARPVMNVLSSAHEKAVQVLENAGIPLDAAQKTGSAFLNKVRSSFSDNPFTAGAQSELARVQHTGFNKAVLRTIGEDATAATPEVMNAAESRINGVFKSVLDRNNISVTDPVLNKIGNIQAAAIEEEKKPVAGIANRIINSVREDGTIPGQVAYGIKKDLDRLSSSSDTTLAYHARQLRSTVMDAINDSLPDADRTAFAQARSQFGNMKKIEPAIDRIGNGDISPAKLANVMSQKANRQASIYGKGNQELVDLAHSGNMLLPDKAQNSGSVARAAMQLGLPLIAGGAEGAYTGDWEKAVGTTAALAAIPKTAQFMMNNPATSKYLTQGMQGGMKPIRDLLLLPQTNVAVGGALRRVPGSFAKQQN